MMISSENKSSILRPVFCLLLFLSVLIAYLRIYFGIDFTDEAFYASVTHSLTKGAVPFKDELSLQVNSSLLQAIPTLIFIKMAGGTDGIMLFLRHLYFVSVALVAFALAKRFSEKNNRDLIVLLSLLFGFSYFNIPALSYNTTSIFLFALGISLTSRIGAQRSTPHSIGTGVCFALSAASYPTHAITIPITVFLLRHQLKFWVVIIAGVAASILYFAVLAALGTTPEDFFTGLNYVQSLGYKLTLDRLFSLRGMGPYWRTIASLLMVGAYPFIKSNRIRPIFLCSGLILLIWAITNAGPIPTFSTSLWTATAWLGLALYIYSKLCSLELDQKAKDLLPAFFAFFCYGYVTSISSGNGATSGHLGWFFSASLLYFWFFNSKLKHRKSLALGFVGAIVLFQSFSLLANSYRDLAPFSEKRVRLLSGPYAGLIGGPDKFLTLQGLERLFQDTLDHQKPGLAVDRIPFVYLFSSAPPATFTTWHFWKKPPEITRVDYERFRRARPKRMPTWVIEANLSHKNPLPKEIGYHSWQEVPTHIPGYRAWRPTQR